MKTALLLTVWFFSALPAESVTTYSNPVLVDTYSIHRVNPAPYVGILGIGDPTVLFHNGTYYLYPTGDNRSYDGYISSDLVRWTKGPKVFQTRENGVWAPDVFYNRDDGRFYLYYTINGKIGVAVADRPDGVFKKQKILIDKGIDAHLCRVQLD